MPKAPTEIRSFARKYTESAMKTLIGIMQQPDAPPAARIQAATAILDRGWGKSMQAMELSGKDGNPIELLLGQIDGTSKGLPVKV